MMCQECDILPLAPFGVRLDYWWCCHWKKAVWASVGLFLVVFFIFIVIKANKTDGRTERVEELGENSMDKPHDSSSVVGANSFA